MNVIDVAMTEFMHVTTVSVDSLIIVQRYTAPTAACIGVTSACASTSMNRNDKFRIALGEPLYLNMPFTNVLSQNVLRSFWFDKCAEKK